MSRNEQAVRYNSAGHGSAAGAARLGNTARSVNMLNAVSIENFTVFKKAKFDFVSGINVLVGANAS